MAKVLVVDDEAEILSSIRRELFEEDYELITALGPREGMAVMDRERVDLVISDMRMPEIDGLRFLEIVQMKHPNTHRIILSGCIDEAQTYEAIAKGIATAYIPKPWTNVMLIRQIRRCLEIREVLGRWELLDVITHIDKLPSLPSTYHEFVSALRKDAPTEKIARIIKRDMAIAARVLRLANSAHYGTREINTIERAILIMGVEAIRNVFLMMTVMNLPRSGQEARLKEIVIQSAMISQYLDVFHDQKTGRRLPESYSSLGIILDVGQLILLQYLPSRFNSIMELKRARPGLGFYGCETELGFAGSSHQEIGAYFLRWWNLPDALVEAVMYHQTPGRASQDVRDVLETAQYVEAFVSEVWRQRHKKRLDITRFAAPWIPEKKATDIATAMTKEIAEQEKSTLLTGE